MYMPVHGQWGEYYLIPDSGDKLMSDVSLDHIVQEKQEEKGILSKGYMAAQYVGFSLF